MPLRVLLKKIHQMWAGSHFCLSNDRGGSMLSDLITRTATVLAVIHNGYLAFPVA